MTNSFSFTFVKTLLIALAVIVLRFSISSEVSSESGLQTQQSASLDNPSQSSCPPRCAADRPTSEKHKGSRIFYLVIVHNERTMNDALHLFRAIRDPRNIILVHVDKKAEHLLRNETNPSSPSLLYQEIESCPCGSTVRIESHHDVKWSHWSMNLPTLWGMQVAVEEYTDQWDVFINLAGDNLSVYTADSMAARLEQLPYNFVTSSSCETGLLPSSVYIFPSWWHKRAHYTRQDTEPDPVFDFTTANGTHQRKTVITHFGSQWVILQANFCTWLVRELQRVDSLPSLFRDYLIASGKLMTDETFIPTILMHSDEFKDSLPSVLDDPNVQEDGELLWKNGSTSGITSIRYERMDEHTPSAFGYFAAQQRYRVPASSQELEEPRPWGPYFLGVYDLANIRESGALFIRKVSEHVDPNLLHLLPVERSEDIPPIQWPEEVAISDKPDWEKRKAELIAKAIEKAQQKEMDEEHADDQDEEEL
jgi:hypothetical protein